MKKLTAKQFIEKSIKIHGNKYDYSNVVYINNTTNVNIICKKHGLFYQKPREHTSGRGCRECGYEKVSKDRTVYTTESFVKKSKQKFGNIYDYSMTKYNGIHELISVGCKKHGVFEVKAERHIAENGGQCPECSKRKKYTTDSFIKMSNIVHENRYSYDKVEHMNSETKVTIICPEHGEFNQFTRDHLSGCGCPSCNSGFNPNKKTILYYLSISNGTAFKVGITNRSVNERYSPRELKKIKIIKEWIFDSGTEAYDEEQKILKKFKEATYKGKPLLITGNTELFKYDVLGLCSKNSNIIQ